MIVDPLKLHTPADFRAPSATIVDSPHPQEGKSLPFVTVADQLQL